MRDINLFEGIKKNVPQKKASQGISFGLVLLLLCIVVVGGAWGYFKYTETNIDSQIDSVSQSISAKQAGNPGAGDAAAKQNQLAAIAVYNTALLAFQKDVQGYPAFNLALLSDMAKKMPSDVTVQSINYEKGVLKLLGTASNIDSPANFAAALKNSAFFDRVDYIGSTYQVTPDTAAAGTYQYTVDCYLKGGAVQ